MKGNVATKDVPVLVISGRGDDATRLRVLQAGAADFILKPVNRADLCQRVRTFRAARQPSSAWPTLSGRLRYAAPPQ